MYLTADLGNSRLKLALWPASADAGPGAPAVEPARVWTARADDLAQGAGGAFAPPFAGVFLGSVADEARTGELAERLAALTGRLEVDPASGLENATRAPETVGRDRLFAARAALALAPAGALVVDVGTALTVDAVVPGAEGPFAGRFLGGAIAPGVELGARALADHTARLPRVEPRPGARALGRDTPEALVAGLVVGLRGAARELVAEVGREAGLAAAPVFLTGGARDYLLRPAPLFPPERLRVDPALVHRGLLLAGLARGEEGA